MVSSTTMLRQERQRRRTTRTMIGTLLLTMMAMLPIGSPFHTVAPGMPATAPSFVARSPASLDPTSATLKRTGTQLHMSWWYGGSETTDMVEADSCELVAVRIERTSSNSRRIFGEITVPTPIKDVWAILTDYNRLAIHVPNLVESRVERPLSGGEMGDGQYSCRLYQKGAQKIIGFEFGASVTMNMQESVLAAFPPSSSNGGSVGDQRTINFKCVDSFFFQEFDGEWRAQERISGDDGTSVETLLSYTVDVRPKGPVPVAALEWRIREDVPTNLRAVKKSAMEVGHKGVMATRNATGMKTATVRLPGSGKRGMVKIQWYKDETMGTYLPE